AARPQTVRDNDTPPWEMEGSRTPYPEPPAEDIATGRFAAKPEEDEIPICPVEDLPPVPSPVPLPVSSGDHTSSQPFRTVYSLPSTELLNEIPGRSVYDEQELKDTAV